MKRLRFCLIFNLFIATLIVMLLGACYPKNAIDVTPDMQGKWQGEAKIIVSWCQQDSLKLDINILPSGTVTGTVGDASLQNAYIGLNRGPIGALLNLASDYIIVGDLDGAIVAAEAIERSSVKIPLDFIGGRFVGGLHTSGNKIGDETSMILSASDLLLSPVLP